jgi:hypothetical protein
VVVPVREAFLVDAVYPPGPLHAYVAPVTAGVVNVKVVPTQIGELLEAVAVGDAFTVTVVEEEAEHPLTVVVIV